MREGIVRLHEEESDRVITSSTSGDMPKTHDVVIARAAAADGKDEFTVCQLPHAPQLLVGSQAEALRLGDAFARHHRVDLWLTTDSNTSSRRVATYRSSD